jgi:hypothetical protein
MIFTGNPVTAERATEVLMICPPPSPVEPSTKIGSDIEINYTSLFNILPDAPLLYNQKWFIG